MASIGKIAIDLEANTARFVDGMNRATKSLDKMKQSISIIKLDAIINLGERAFRAAGRIFNLAESLATFGSDLTRMSKTMGMSIQQFQEWRYVAKMSDVEFQQINMGFRLLTQNALDFSRGIGEAKRSFERLGITTIGEGGRLKSINELILELSERLTSIKDPTERLGLVMEIFGSRSGEAFDQLLRQGRPAIEALIREFNALGFSISEDWIKRLGESEQSFKRFDFAIQKLKAALVPAVEAISKAINNAAINIANWATVSENAIERATDEAIKHAKRWKEYYEKEGFPQKMIDDLARLIQMYEELKKIRAEKGVAVLVEPRLMEYAIPGAKPGKEEIPTDIKRTQEEINKLLKEGAEFRKWAAANAERIEQFTWGELAAETKVYEILEKERKSEEERLQLMEAHLSSMLTFGELEQQQIKEAKRGFQDYIDSLDIIHKKEYERYELAAKQAELLWGFPAMEAEAQAALRTNEKTTSEMEKAWKDFTSSVSSSFQAGFFDLFKRGIDDIGDVWEQFCDNILQSFLRTLSSMITNYLLFGNLLGQGFGAAGATSPSTTTGWVGILGTLGKLFKMQHGGSFWASKPTPILVGERGREFVSVTPESKMQERMKGEGTVGNTLVYFINPIGFDERLMRSMGSIINGIRQNARQGATMRKIIRNT